MQYALGLIETVGLAAAIQASDAALKTANVTLAGIENSKGNGRQTVFLLGDVASIIAAVDAGINSANVAGVVYASKVIASPSESLKEKLSKLNIVNFEKKESVKLAEVVVKEDVEQVKATEPKVKTKQENPNKKRTNKVNKK